MAHGRHCPFDAPDDSLEAVRSAVHLHLVTQSGDLPFEFSGPPRADPLVVAGERAVDRERGDMECRRGCRDGPMLRDRVDDLLLAR
jgi:hypothetical protein